MIRVKVHKAKRPKWSKTRSRSRLEALSEAMSGAVRIDFLKGMTRFKKRINKESIYQAWLKRDYHKLYSFVPWHHLPADMAPFAKGVGGAVRSGASSTIETLPPPTMRALRFDMKNPNLRHYVNHRVGELIVGINRSTQDVIAKTIGQSFDKALTPRRVADRIKSSIGLYPGQVTALENFRGGLEEQGLPQGRIDELSGAYEARLLDYRAMMIARTESSDAFNTAQNSVWSTAADQGLIDRESTKKQWVTDGNPCPACVELEDQGPIDIDDMWDTDDGPIDGPTLHPNCLCGVKLVFSKEEG